MPEQARYCSLAGFGVEVNEHIATEDHIERPVHGIRTLIEVEASEVDHFLNANFDLYPPLLIGEAP